MRVFNISKYAPHVEVVEHHQMLGQHSVTMELFKLGHLALRRHEGSQELRTVGGPQIDSRHAPTMILGCTILEGVGPHRHYFWCFCSGMHVSHTYTL
jgi:hypothetical protein